MIIFIGVYLLLAVLIRVHECEGDCIEPRSILEQIGSAEDNGVIIGRFAYAYDDNGDEIFASTAPCSSDSDVYDEKENDYTFSVRVYTVEEIFHGSHVDVTVGDNIPILWDTDTGYRSALPSYFDNCTEGFLGELSPLSVCNAVQTFSMSECNYHMNQPWSAVSEEVLELLHGGTPSLTDDSTRVENDTDYTIDVEQECPGGFVECVDGMAGNSTNSSQTCEEACGGKCCVGSKACTGFTGTVCKDDTSCFGNESCSNANIDVVVRGCNGHYACESAAHSSWSIAMVIDSCHGDYAACRGAAQNGGSIRKIINACRGFAACSFAASRGGVIGAIVDSCYETNSCSGVAACTGNAQCGSSIIDISSSCNGVRACYWVASDGGTIDSIKHGCNAASCNDFCFSEYPKCEPFMTCDEVGACKHAASKGGSIDGISNACNANKACYEAAKGNSGDISAGINNRCNTENECETTIEAYPPRESPMASAGYYVMRVCAVSFLFQALGATFCQIV